MVIPAGAILAEQGERVCEFAGTCARKKTPSIRPSKKLAQTGQQNDFFAAPRLCDDEH
jgi:hypothetical protein